MNLARALDVALPEIPARTLAQRYPRIEPGITFREHVEDGQVVVRFTCPASRACTSFLANFGSLCSCSTARGPTSK